MAFEDVTLVAAGSKFQGWEEVTISAGLNMPAPQAIIRVSEVPDKDKAGQVAAYFEKWHFPPFTSVQLFASGNLFITGYVNEYRPAQSATDHSVTLVVVGNQQGIVDSSAFHPTGEWNNANPLQIAAEMSAGAGVGVEARGLIAQPINIFRLRKGSTIIAELQRLLQPQMATIFGDIDGKAIIAGYGFSFGSHPGSIRQGVEIQEQSAKLSAQNRFDTYYVQQQNALGVDPEKDIEGEGTAVDPGVPLPRKKLIIQTMPGNPQDAQKRAVWEAARAYGFSCEADITVRGWRDADGTPWRPGYLVHVYSPALKIDQSMLIEQVEFRQGNPPLGTVTTLHVVNPLAYGINGGASGSDQMWTQAPPIIDFGGGDGGGGDS